MSATHRRSNFVVALAAVAGALVAAGMSTASAPTARADDFTQLIDTIDSDFFSANEAFTSAASDFGSADYAQGLTQLVDGVDDYALSPTYTVASFTAGELSGNPVFTSIAWGLFAPTDYANGVTLADSFLSEGQTLLTDSASALAGGEYVTASTEFLTGLDYTAVFAPEELLLGALVSF